MNTYTVTIGADLRCYAEITIHGAPGTTKEQARDMALKRLKDDEPLVLKEWPWKIEEVQGDVSARVTDADDPDDDAVFEPVDWGTPRYSALEAFVDKMARFTTPEDEIADAGTGQPVDEFVADLDDERLWGEYATFMEMVRLARAIMKGGAA